MSAIPSQARLSGSSRKPHAPSPSSGDVPRAQSVGTGTIDPQAIEAARREIQQALESIGAMVGDGLPPEDFYRETLVKAVGALAAQGGAIWVRSAGGGITLACQVHLQSDTIFDGGLIQSQHELLLASVLDKGQELVLPPHTRGRNEGEIANPTDHLIVLAPFHSDTGHSDTGVQGVLEILQRPNSRPQAQQGYLRFVKQVCRALGDYLQGRRLQQFTDKESLWNKLDEFALRVHRSLDVKETCYMLAGEGRRLIGCDRVSVILWRRGRAVVMAISGQESFQRRSNQVRRLCQLGRVVMQSGESVWYGGDKSELAPQVERALDEYVDLSHARSLAVVPLKSHQPEDSPGKRRQPAPIIGAIVVEQFGDNQLQQVGEQRVQAVTGHGSAAVSNALEHDSVLLLPVWKALGKTKLLLAARNLPKTILALLLLGGLIAALVKVPADFAPQAKGALQPTVRREVFAGIDGMVVEVAVEHGDQVTAGQPLVRLQNTDLDVQLTDVLGRREASLEQIIALERSLLGDNESKAQMTVEEQNRLAGQLLEERRTYASLGRQIELLREKQQKLAIASPITGQVITWQVRERLQRRPVRQGQVLVSVADPDGPWELEVYLPEDRIGHVAAAAEAHDEPLPVSFVLATEPETTYQGHLREIHTLVEVHQDQGNVVVLRVAIDKDQLQDLRPGATVTAKINCGERSLGYVLFHDLVAFVQSRILFRLTDLL